MRILIDPSQITAGQVRALILLRQSEEARRTADAIVGALRLLASNIDAGALMRRAIASEDPLGWLRDTAAVVQGVSRLQAERTLADAVEAAWKAEHHRLDSAAMRMLTEERIKADSLRQVLARFKQSVEELRSTLAKAGFVAEEIDEAVRVRLTAPHLDHARQEAEAGVADADQACAALSAFLADPLRRLELLPPALSASLQALAGAMQADTMPSRGVAYADDMAGASGASNGA